MAKLAPVKEEIEEEEFEIYDDLLLSDEDLRRKREIEEMIKRQKSFKLESINDSELNIPDYEIPDEEKERRRSKRTVSKEDSVYPKVKKYNFDSLDAKFEEI